VATIPPPATTDRPHGHHNEIDRLALQLFQGAQTAVATQQPRKRLLHADDLDTLPPTSWLKEGELPANAFVVLYGLSEGGKSFAAINYALELSEDHNVVYVAAEGAGGYAARKNAWCSHHKRGSGSLFFWPYAVNLLNKQELQEFLDAIADLERPIVILDTLARCMVGGDENSARDMGLAIDACDTIKRTTGETVMVVHHTGKNGASERGSSALRGAADAMIELQNDDGLITLSCSKMKDAPHFQPRRYRLLPVGDSCVIVPSEQVIVTRDTPLTERQRKVLEALSFAVFEDTGAKASQLSEYAPAGTLFRVLSELKRRGLIEQSAKGDPYYITEQGKQALRPVESHQPPKNELSHETAHSKAQLSQLSHDYQATIDSDTTQLLSLSHSLRSDSDSSSDSSLTDPDSSPARQKTTPKIIAGQLPHLRKNGGAE
jgi:hypothetical protein